MTTATQRLALFAAATTALLVSACSSPLPASSGAPTPAVTTTTILGANTAALTKGADLRARLVTLMVEHAYLLGRVTGEIAASPSKATAAPTTAGPTTTGPTTTGPTTTGPTTTTAPVPLAELTSSAGGLDKNSHDLADLISAPYNAEFAGRFYELWTKRIAAIEAYARAKVSGDGAAQTDATTQLTTVTADLATLFHTDNKFIEVHTVSSPGTGLRDELEPDNTAMTDLADAQVAKDPAAIGKQVAAAERMPHTATYLAAAAAKLSADHAGKGEPGDYPGTVTGSAANLRASLTASLVEHVELASMALEQVGNGKDAGPVEAALGSNAQQLANVFSAVYSDQDAAAFLAQWRSHDGLYLDYAAAKAGSDTAKAAAASSKLDDFSTAIGAFLSQVTKGGLNASTATSDFRAQVASILAVADAAAGHTGDDVTLIRTADAHMTDTGALLSEAIAEQFRAKYLP